VAITGVTGFVGSIVLRDVLRLCKSIAHIYVLIRSRNGKNIHERLIEVLRRPLFDEIKKEDPEVLARVSPIEWDMASGPAPLPHNANIVLHCASANVHDALSTKKIVETNYGGLRRLTDAAEKSHATVVYLSSTSSLEDLCGDCAVEEAIYPLGSNHESLYKQLTQLGSCKARRILGEHGFKDAHAISFRMCELLMEDFHTKASLSSFRRQRAYQYAMSRGVGCHNKVTFGGAVVRASDVVGMIGDGPLCGYVSSSSSVTTAGILAIRSGRLRRSSLKPTDVLSVVPGDQVASLIVGVATWLISKHCSSVISPLGPGDLARAMDFAHADPFCVFHACTSGARSPLTFGRFSRTVIQCSENASPQSTTESIKMPLIRTSPEDPGCFAKLKQLHYRCIVALSKVFCSKATTVELRNRARVNRELGQGIVGHGLNRRYEVKNTYGLQLLLNQADQRLLLPRKEDVMGKCDGGKWRFVFPSNPDDWEQYIKSFCDGAVSLRDRSRSSSWAGNASKALQRSLTLSTKSAKEKEPHPLSKTPLERGKTFRYCEFFGSSSSTPQPVSTFSEEPSTKLNEPRLPQVCEEGDGRTSRIQAYRSSAESLQIGKVTIRTDETLSRSRTDSQTKSHCFVITSSYKDSPLTHSDTESTKFAAQASLIIKPLKQASDTFKTGILPLLEDDFAFSKSLRTYASAA